MFQKKTLIKYITFSCALTVFCFSLEAQAQSVSLYDLDFASAPIDLEHFSIIGAVDAMAISLDPQELTKNPETLEFELPDGRFLDAARERFVAHEDGYISWIGASSILGSDVKGYVHLIYHGDSVSGIVNHGREQFQIAFHNGRHALVRLGDHPAARNCLHAGTAKSLPEREPGEKKFDASSERPEETAVGDRLVIEGKALTRIDVLALYTSNLLGSQEQSAVNFIQSSIAIANDAFNRSNIPAYYRLVHVGPILGQQPPSNDLRTIMNWLESEPTEIQQIRNASGADMVAFFVPQSYGPTNVCGIANLPSNSKPLGQKAFSAMRVHCGLNDFTLAHELGHNFGMLHHNTDPTGYLFSYGRGHLFQVGSEVKASIMGCSYQGGPVTGAVCNRVPHFSDPAIQYMGVATGTSTRNNAAVARTQIRPYSNFRPTASGCVGGSTTLCLQSGRFKVEVDYVLGGTRKASVRSYSNEAGFFWFGSSSNLEVAVKILDGRWSAGRWWVFHGALTSLAYTVKVTDTQTGRVTTYNRPATSGTTSCGGADIDTLTRSRFEPIASGWVEFPGGAADIGADADLDLTTACSPASTRLCLLGNRFQVEVTRGSTLQRGVKLTDQSGSFYFFNSSNPEVPVKILDGRPVNGKFWAFFGSLTNLGYQVKVKDTATGITRTYTSPAPHCGTLDTSAF